MLTWMGKLRLMLLLMISRIVHLANQNSRNYIIISKYGHFSFFFFGRGSIFVIFLFSGSLSARYGRYRMSASYYFEGDCTKTETTIAIKQQFIKTLSSSITFEAACSASEEKCKIENVQVQHLNILDKHLYILDKLKCLFDSCVIYLTVLSAVDFIAI